MLKVLKILCLILIIAMVFISCAAGQNPMEKKNNEYGFTAGFFRGLWHGLIAPITFIISIFSKSVHFYEVHNNGFGYNLGFIIGAGLFLSGGILGSKKRSD